MYRARRKMQIFFAPNPREDIKREKERKKEKREREREKERKNNV